MQENPSDQGSSNDQQDFYVVSMGKFTWLFFSTMGFYIFYWFFKNWYLREIQTRDKFTSFTSSLLAGFFQPLFAHVIFLRIRKAEIAREMSYPWNPIALAWGFIGVNIAILLFGMTFQPTPENAWVGMLIKYPIYIAIYYILYKVQLVANRVSQDPFGKANARFSEINVFCVVMGITFQVLGVYTVISGDVPVPQQAPLE